jgi:hypothetical protein
MNALEARIITPVSSIRTVSKKKPAHLRPQAVPFTVNYRQTLVDPDMNADVFGGWRRSIVEHTDRSA